MLERSLMNYEPKSIFDLFFNDDSFTFRNTSLKTNLKETENEYQLDLIIPGFKKDDIDITIDNNILKISSKKEKSNKTDDDEFIRQEYFYSSFEKHFKLPENINVDDIQAKQEDGILKISIPKGKEINVQKQIEIK